MKKSLPRKLEQRLFYQKLLLIQDFDYRSKNDKRNWVSVLLSSEMYYLSIGQGLTLSPMENYQVFLYFIFFTGPRSAVGNLSGNRCKSDCRSRGREFDPGPVLYFRGDLP